MPQMNPRAIQPGGPVVGPGPANLLDVRAYLRQYTTWNFRTPLGPDDYFWRTEQLKSAITTSATTASVTYNAPANFNMLIQKIRGHLAFNNGDGETLSIDGIGNPFVKDRMLLKAMNTRLALQNTGRTAKVFSTADLPLSSILESVGGKALDFSLAPLVVPDGEGLQLDISTQDTASALIGGSTDMGVELVALFVRTRP